MPPDAPARAGSRPPSSSSSSASSAPGLNSGAGARAARVSIEFGGFGGARGDASALVGGWTPSTSSSSSSLAGPRHPRSPPTSRDFARGLAHRASAPRASGGGVSTTRSSDGDGGARSRVASPGAAASPSSPSSPSPSSDDGVLIAESRSNPGVAVVYRSRATRDAAPERLDLDRRGLTACAEIEGEHRLRLLNYQHNRIRSIERMERTRALVFLDLYDNALRSVDGLDAVPGLRVLMLGRNEIQVVDGLSRLTRLDVLDLHDNEIHDLKGLRRGEGGEALRSLRVLNLAGNRVREIGDLSALEGLAELNLRRNVVSRLGDDDGGGGVGGAEPTRLPPNLQRVFLSGNALRTFDALTPLRALRRLTEASVDGNPFAERGDLRGDGGGGAAAVRRRVLEIIYTPTLRCLDNVAVGARERAELAELDATATAADDADMVEGLFKTSGSEALQDAGAGLSGSTKYLERVAAAAHGLRLTSSSSSPPPPPSRTTNDDATRVNAHATPTTKPVAVRALRTGLHATGWDVATKTLTVYGSVENLAEDANAPHAECVILRYMSNKTHMSETLRSIKTGMPRVHELRLEECALSSLSFLDELAALGLGGSGDADGRFIAKLSVSATGNPALRSLTLYRPYATRTLPSLETIDGVDVSAEDRDAARALFAPLDDEIAASASVVSSFQRQNAHQRDVTSIDPNDARALLTYARAATARAKAVAEKLRILDERWDGLVRGYAREGLELAAASSPGAVRKSVGETKCS